MLGSRKCNIIYTRLRHQCSPLGADLFRAKIINDSSCPYGCPLEDDIHYSLECPLYTNAGMKLFMNITPYAVISIETLLFGSDNITDETNLIVFTNEQMYLYIYHTNRFAFNPLSSFSSHHCCLSNICMYTCIIYVTCCHFHIHVHNIIVWIGCTKLI
jgi:hypothetical protein